MAIAAGVVVLVVSPDARKPLTSRLFASTTSDVITYEVKSGKLPVTVVERGGLESSKNEDVYSQVEGQTTIISIKPEGSKVGKGDLVCELDSATLRDNRTTQEITTQSAEALFKQAKLTREVTQVAVIEYREGTYKQEYENIKSEIELAKANLTRAEQRYDYSVEMAAKKYIPETQKISDRFTLQQCKFNLEQSQTKLHVLETYTKGKTIKELEADVEKAISDEKSKESTWKLETQKLDKYIRQIDQCKMFAPGDGLIVYANDPNRFGGGNSVQIEEGASVRERQKIFSLPDISHMRVNTKVHESMVDRVVPGQRALIRVDAFPGEVMTGKVDSVAPLPDPNSFFSSDIKVYSTFISIDNGSTSLRPGMTAQVEILVTELENVMAVPVQAILPDKGKDYVFVKMADGTYDRHEVELGTTNDKLIELKKGVKVGEMVALAPETLLNESERQALKSSKEATKKDFGGDTPKKEGEGAEAKPKAKGKAEDAAKGADTKGATDAEGKPKAKGKRAGGAGGGLNPAMFQKLGSLSEDERAQLRTGSDEERKGLLKKAGLTDAEIEQMAQMRAQMGAGGGPGGGGGPPGGGRPGGGGPGGPNP